MDDRAVAIIEERLRRRQPRRCLEWGAGLSTLYFSDLLTEGATWTSVEHDGQWEARARRFLGARLLSLRPVGHAWSATYLRGQLSAPGRVLLETGRAHDQPWRRASVARPGVPRPAGPRAVPAAITLVAIVWGTGMAQWRRAVTGIALLSVPALLLVGALLEGFFRFVVPASELPHVYFDRDSGILRYDTMGQRTGTFTTGKYAQQRGRWRINSPIDYRRPRSERSKPLLAIIGCAI
jgi:hypothetical protein